MYLCCLYTTSILYTITYIHIYYYNMLYTTTVVQVGFTSLFHFCFVGQMLKGLRATALDVWKWGSVEVLWKTNILPAVDSTLNKPQIEEKRFDSDWDLRAKNKVTCCSN